MDENLCGHFAARLRVAGLRVEELHEHLPRGTKDTEWLPYVGSQGWVAVTADLFRDDPEEQLALMMHGVPVPISYTPAIWLPMDMCRFH